jgi:hypothetical protein
MLASMVIADNIELGSKKMIRENIIKAADVYLLAALAT